MNKDEKLGVSRGVVLGRRRGKERDILVMSKFFKVGSNFGSFYFICFKFCEVKILK